MTSSPTRSLNPLILDRNKYLAYLICIYKLELYVVGLGVIFFTVLYTYVQK